VTGERQHAEHKTIFYDVYCHDCGRGDVWEVERDGGWREIICDACGSQNVTASRDPEEKT
jgi:hypothetical protein